MLSRLKDVLQFPHENSQTLRRRLLLYMLALVVLLGAVTAGCMLSLGHFSSVKQLTGSQLSTQLSIYERDVSGHFDHLAALGIKLSKDLTQALEDELRQQGRSFAQLNDNQNAIVQVENRLYETLYQSILLSDCSGAYFLLNATVNTKAANAGDSNCGLYFKIANVSVESPVDPKLIQFRGSTEVARNRNIGYHNQWALEFNTQRFPCYSMLMEKAVPNLNDCFLFTDAVELPGTWERVILLCVPLVGENGTVYGICGYEISQVYFKIAHAQPSVTPHLTGLLGRRTPVGLCLDGGVESGDRDGYFAGLSGTLSIKPEKEYSVYRQGDRSFVGQERALRLSPLEQARTVAVMIPLQDVSKAHLRNVLWNAVMLLLLFLLGAVGCFWVSSRYVRPILIGLEQARHGGKIGQRTNILEIDDLLEFLAGSDVQLGVNPLIVRFYGVHG